MVVNIASELLSNKLRILKVQLPSLQLPGTGTDLLISSYVVAGSICNYMYLNSARFSCLVSEILIIFEAKCGKAHLYDVNIGGVKKKCLSDCSFS